MTLSLLFKARVVSLLLMAAVGGAFLGAAGWPGIGTMALVLVSGWLAASGSAGLNQFIERKSDAKMRRTRRRPLVTGDIQATWVPWVSGAMILLPCLIILPFNTALSVFLFTGAVIYVGLYTILLKPRTPLNIVIGGAAGSAAVLSGGAAAGAWRDPAVITLALLVFLWTPCHFWSLAILYREDYARVGLPMLPAKITVQASAWWVLLHSAGAGFAALLLSVTPQLGWLYFIPVVVATVDILARNIRLIKNPTPRHARSFFISSNLYLLVVLLAACLSASMPGRWPAL